jgi:hypothetical protein
MKPGRAHSANHLENFLEKTKLVWRKGIVGSEIIPIHIGFEGHAAVPEGQLVAKDVALFGKNGLEVFYHGVFFFKQPFLDHLVGIGAGQG